MGCMEKLGHAAGGAGVAIMAPLLDNQVGKLNMLDTATGEKMEKRLPTLEEGKNCLSHNHVLNYFRTNRENIQIRLMRNLIFHF